jgi:hypothetical protein
LQKRQQRVVPTAGKAGKIGAAQFLSYSPGYRFIELFVEGDFAQVAPPALDRRPQLLQHMGNAAAASGQVQI